MRADQRRSRIQDFARTGSAGQRARRLRHAETPASISMTPENANNGFLCSESQTSCGTAAITLASAAPAPIDVSNAGIAQQSKVLNELRIVSASRTMVRSFMIFSE